jgi:hypothetical protein
LDNGNLSQGLRLPDREAAHSNIASILKLYGAIPLLPHNYSWLVRVKGKFVPVLN